MRGMPVEKLSVTGTGAETSLTATANEMFPDCMSAGTDDNAGNAFFHIVIISRLDGISGSGDGRCNGGASSANVDDKVRSNSTQKVYRKEL